jgi:hypothetical protein
MTRFPIQPPFQTHTAIEKNFTVTPVVELFREITRTFIPAGSELRFISIDDILADLYTLVYNSFTAQLRAAQTPHKSASKRKLQRSLRLLAEVEGLWYTGYTSTGSYISIDIHYRSYPATTPVEIATQQFFMQLIDKYFGERIWYWEEEELPPPRSVFQWF